MTPWMPLFDVRRLRFERHYSPTSWYDCTTLQMPHPTNTVHTTGSLKGEMWDHSTWKRSAANIGFGLLFVLEFATAWQMSSGWQSLDNTR